MTYFNLRVILSHFVTSNSHSKLRVTIIYLFYIRNKNAILVFLQFDFLLNLERLNMLVDVDVLFHVCLAHDAKLQIIHNVELQIKVGRRSHENRFRLSDKTISAFVKYLSRMR